MTTEDTEYAEEGFGLSGAEEEDGDSDVVADFRGGRAEEEVGKKAVAVGAHGDEVAMLFFDPFDDLVGRIAVGEFGVGGDSD